MPSELRGPSSGSWFHDLLPLQASLFASVRLLRGRLPSFRLPDVLRNVQCAFSFCVSRRSFSNVEPNADRNVEENLW